MSISEREQQTLESIGEGLARSAPKLASMLAMFSRLTADEEMPVRDRIWRAARGLGTGAVTAAGRAGPGRVRRHHVAREARRWVWLCDRGRDAGPDADREPRHRKQQMHAFAHHYLRAGARTRPSGRGPGRRAMSRRAWR